MIHQAVDCYHTIRGEDGPWVLLLHGLFGSHNNLGGIARVLSAHYRVLMVDLRNHGRSPHSDFMSYDHMVTDFVGLLDQHDIDSAIVIGHSMGGKLAMGLASQHSQRVRAAVIVDIAPVDYPPHHETVFRALRSLDLRGLKSRAQADKQMAREIDDIGLRQFLLSNLKRADDGFQWRMNLNVIEEQYDEIAAAPELKQPYQGPCLFIRGGESDYIDADGRQIIQRWFPGAEIATIEESGHWPHSQHPEAFNTLVESFLQQNR